MSSENCIHACRSPYYRHGEPCMACQRWHDEQMDRSYADYVREQQGLTVDDAKPATDAEFLAWLDTQAPRVASTVKFDFRRSKPFIEDDPRFETA